MLDTRLPRYLLTLDGPGWSHPYPVGPFSPFFYKDGGDGGDDGGDDDGADDEGGKDDDSDDDQDDDRDGDDQDKDDDGDDDLGEKGRKALRTLRRENRTLKAENRTLKGAASTKKPAAKDGEGGKDDDQEEIRRQAREEAQAEVWADRVESAAIAAAAGRLANPQLAARLLDLSDVPKNDKGRPDREAITELIDELLEDEPYLAAKSATDTGGRRFQGGADGGARKPAKKSAKSLEEAVAAKLAGKSG
ncbi:hypothetical protein ACIO6U_03755 [Streptomyces sp. NPDC087422]|uniref:hypothetical protein n=1 Tax=Streptomyces sp. NPDC087422 TaxID=3365786 RepID=UPI00380B8E11